MSDNNNSFCFRCYHNWQRRRENLPKVCPKCKSPYWNRPRKKGLKKLIEGMNCMIINIHDGIINISGGESGIRDGGGIYNSLYKLLNYQNRNKKNPSNIGAFALNEFAKRHYFVDGNKRTAYAIAKILMLVNKCHLKIKYKEATDFIIKIAEYESKIGFEEIKKWIKQKCIIIEEKELENYLSRNFVNLMLGDEEDEK